MYSSVFTYSFPYFPVTVENRESASVLYGLLCWPTDSPIAPEKWRFIKIALVQRIVSAHCIDNPFSGNKDPMNTFPVKNCNLIMFNCNIWLEETFWPSFTIPPLPSFWNTKQSAHHLSSVHSMADWRQQAYGFSGAQLHPNDECLSQSKSSEGLVRFLLSISTVMGHWSST